MSKVPTKCHYTEDAIKSYRGFDYLTIGSGCRDCKLIDSETCGYVITEADWDAITASPDDWKLIAHCDLGRHTNVK